MSIDANDLILFARVVEAGRISRAIVRTELPKSILLYVGVDYLAHQGTLPPMLARALPPLCCFRFVGRAAFGSFAWKRFGCRGNCRGRH